MSTAESKRIKDLDHEIRELKRANEILKRAPSSFGAEFDRQLSGADTRSFKLNQVRLPWSSTGSPSCTSAGPQSRSCSAMPSSLAEEWTDRFLASATLATTEHQALQCISPDNVVEATDLDPGRARTRAQHRQSPRGGPQHRPVGARSRPTPPRNLAGLARSEHGLRAQQRSVIPCPVVTHGVPTNAGTSRRKTVTAPSQRG